MRRLHAMIACSALALLALAPAMATTEEIRPELVAMGGWSWPVEGDFEEMWNSGFDLSGGLRTPVAPHLSLGFNIGYAWYGLKDFLTPANDSGDAGIFSLTTEKDVFLQGRGGDRPVRPFLNVGLGYYYVSLGDREVDLGATVVPGFNGSAFGLHGGGGFLAGNGRVRLRVEARYDHIFMGGEDIGVVPVRGGVQIQLSSR